MHDNTHVHGLCSPGEWVTLLVVEPVMLLNLLDSWLATSSYMHACLAGLSQILGRGFHDTAFHKQFDHKISQMTTHWCCRSDRDVDRFNASAKNVVLRILPESRDPGANVFKAEYGVDQSLLGF